MQFGLVADLFQVLQKLYTVIFFCSFMVFSCLEDSSHHEERKPGLGPDI